MIDAFYTDEFVLPLPEGHRFPMQKYRILRDKVLKSALEIRLCVPGAATAGQLALAHCPNYVASVESGGLSAQAQRDIGFPWSTAMVERSLRSVGATVEAVRSALQHGAAVNLAGGTHHAKRDQGGGFCVFNDVAVAARVFQTDQIAKKPGASVNPQVLIIDLDVHQGDGTAEIFQNDPSVFTFSMHGEKNYPFSKRTSDLDIALPDQTGDSEYLSALQNALQVIEARFKPDLLVYVAGMDVHMADRLGKLSLTDEGVAARDQLVIDWARRRGLPLVVTMAGGYFKDLEHLTDLQLRLVEQLATPCFSRSSTLI